MCLKYPQKVEDEVPLEVKLLLRSLDLARNEVGFLDNILG